MQQRPRKAALFVGLTYLVSYLLVFLYSALVGSWTMPNAVVLGVVYMFVPTTVVLIVQKGIFKEPLKEPLRISFRLNRWFVVAWLLPPLIACASMGVALLVPGVHFSPEMEGMVERFGIPEGQTDFGIHEGPASHEGQTDFQFSFPEGQTDCAPW